MMNGGRIGDIKMGHCCEEMERHVSDVRVPINYLPMLNFYKLNNLERSEVLQDYFIEKNYLHFGKALNYCPWCGKALPKSLLPEWKSKLFKINKKNCFKMSITWLDCFPQEFKSLQWKKLK